MMKNITNFMNVVKNTGVPQSSVLGTTDRHEEKTIDSLIQYICVLEGTTTQSADKKLDDRLVMNHSEAISGRCKLVLLR